MVNTTFRGAAKPLDDVDLPKLGYMMGCGEDELHAFLDVETRGSGFDAQGRPIILFEPHIFYAQLGKGKERDAAVRSGLAYPKWKRDYPPESYTRLKAAIAINREAAFRSVSVGIGQLMGFNFKDAGYGSAEDMFWAFAEDEEEQLLACVKFIKKKGLDKALRAHSWDAFALGYNGKGYKANHYHVKLAAAFKKWQRIKDTPWTPPARGAGASAATFATLRPEPASPVVSAETGDVVYTDQENVAYVQQKLKSLGYTEVGGTEGAMGPFTETAILAFRKDNGLPLASVVDDQLLAALKTAKPRQVAQARTDATAATVVTKVPEARHNWWSKIGAGVLGSGAGSGFVLKSLDKVTDAKSYVNEFTEYFDWPGWVWCLVILAVAGFVYYKSQQSENASVEAFKTGERR